MSNEAIAIIYAIGVAIFAIGVGVATRDEHPKERGWAIFGIFWPAFAGLALFIGFFIGLATFGGWCARQFSKHRNWSHP